MKTTALLLFALASVGVFAQEKGETTDQFNIEGLVKQQLVVNLTGLATYRTYSIDSVIIMSHLMQKKYTMKKLKGVLLKDILDKAGIQSPTPKSLSEYYIVCVASDNYKVVFSWNEIFNTKTGDSIYVLVEQDGKPASSGDDRIALISTSDLATGRRYVKWLKKIIVERVR
jgi:hypothetical protein